MKRLTINTVLLTVGILLLSAGETHGQAKSPFEVYHVSSLSSGSDDMAPVILNDGILYCSNRKTNPFLTKKNLDGVRLYNLWFAPFDVDGNLARPVRFASSLAKDANVGPASVSGDGNTLYFTRNYSEGRKIRRKDSNRLGIFTAKRNGAQWVDVQPFEFNNPDYNLSFPYVSPDGRYLFFCSDMPGGYGKYDVYMCENIGGRWSDPVNLGSNVNSQYAELYPFLHNSGRLYFSSDRPGGHGGLDIWFSTLTYGSWTMPDLLDDPINSKADDFAFYAVQGNLKGYFTSNRSRYSDDIYGFSSTIIRWSSCDTLRKNSYCFEFIEEVALKQDTSDTKFKWEWNFGDGGKAEGITAEHCYQGPGIYDVSLDIVNLITGAIEKRQASYMLEITDIEQPVISCPDNIAVGETMSLNATETYLPGMDISQYYWNFGDETAATGLEVTKVYERPGIYNIQLIVSSKPGTGDTEREVCVCRDIKVTAKGN
jgi:hypothetical protein